MYGFLAFTSGQRVAKTKADFNAEATFYHGMLSYNFGVTTLFWTVLWLVKLTLLLLFLGFLKDTGRRNIVYWGVVTAFTVALYAACLVTQYTSCFPITDFVKLGESCRRRIE